MGHLFDKLPDTFFNVLSSPNRKIYVDCLFVIYHAIDSVEDSFQGERQYVIHKLIDYFEEQKEEFLIDDEETATPRQKAVAVINVLKNNGWLGEEELGDYKTSLNLFDYSIRILDILERITDGEQVEYTGEIYTVYSLLSSFDINDGLTIIDQAYQKIDDVLRKLKTLKANIYRFYHDLIKKHAKDNLQQVLEKLLIDYKENFFDHAYYHLKTTDSLPRYKRAILDKINQIYQNDHYLDQLAEQAMTARKKTEYNDAFNYIESRIRYIRDAMDALEYLIAAIDNKNELYINAAASKIMFLTNTSEDLEGLLNRLFKVLLKEKHFDYSSIFNLIRARNLDDGSIYSPRRQRIDPVAEDINFEQEISDDIKERKLSLLLKQNIYSKVEINKYVQYLLTESDITKASLVPLETNEDFVKLILIFLFSKSVGMSYEVKLLNKDVTLNQIKFVDFEISRKGVRK